MRLVKYNPINEPAFWGNSLNTFFNSSFPKSNDAWYPPVDILNEKEHFSPLYG